MFGFRRSTKTIAVSQLAAYAANPTDFVKRRGGAINKKHARWGNRQHRQAGVSLFNRGLRWISWLVVLCLVGAAWWLWLR